MSRRTFACLALAVVVLMMGGGKRLYAEKSAPELMPRTVSAYVEIGQPKELLHAILDHPLRMKLEQSSVWQQMVNSPKYAQFQQVVEVIEQQAGVKWRPAIEAITGDGVFLAYEPQSQGLILLIRPHDPATADKVRDTIFGLARQDAQNKGNPDPIQSKTYRDFTAYQLGELTVANMGPWIVASNKGDLAKQVADLFLDGGSTLASDSLFVEARKMAMGNSKPPSVWAFARTDALRKTAPLLDAKKSDNPGLEFLAGGIIPALQKAPYATASAWIDVEGVKVSLGLPFDPAWVPAERRFYFGAAGDGAAKPLMPKNTLLSVSIYRDFAAMWQSGPDLFNEAVATKMAQTDSSLSTFFGGKSFSGEVLAAIKPQVRFVAVKQDFKAAGLKEPAIKLPAGALVFGVKPEQFNKVSRHFRVGFQSLLAFVNLDAGQKGRPLLEMKNEDRAGAEIIYTTYGPMDEDASKKPAGDKPMAGKEDIYLNFAPALVMGKEHMALCSSKEIAEELADLLAQPASQTSMADNMLIHLSGPPIAELIRANRAQLVARNMLEKGHDRAQAETEIVLLEAIVNTIQEANVRLTPSAKSLKLEVEVMLTGK